MSEQGTGAPAPSAAPASAESAVVDNKSAGISAEGGDDISAEELAVLESEDSSEGNSSGQSNKEAVQDAVNEQIQKWVLKGLNGEAIEVTDVNDLVKRAQKGLGAELKFQEASEIKKEAAELLKLLHEDPIGLLEELGINTVELAQQRIQKEMEERRKSPEEKAREQELKELEQLRRQVKEQQELAESEKYDRMLSEEQNRIEDGMLTALNEAKLPVKPAYIKKMAEVMQAGLIQGIELTPKEALDFARREVVSDLRELLDASPDDMLEDLIGGANAKRLRKRYLSTARQAKAVNSAPARVAETGTQSVDKDSFYKPKKKTLNMKDWLKGKA
jgi:hypothetical protein